jgi:hypothetical protein
MNNWMGGAPASPSNKVAVKIYSLITDGRHTTPTSSKQLAKLFPD